MNDWLEIKIIDEEEVIKVVREMRNRRIKNESGKREACIGRMTKKVEGH